MDNQSWQFEETTDTIIVSNVDIDWSLVDLSPGARVARGMLYVQRMYPDALSKVDVDILDIGDSECCVLGQIHGSYGLAPEFESTEVEWRQAHGFLLIDDDDLTEDSTDWYLNLVWRMAFLAWRDAS